MAAARGPPGLAGPASGPPAEPPPPAPPGLWQQQAMAVASRPASAAAAGDEASTIDKQREISGTIAAQVARLLEQARVDTENKVKMELKGIRDQMMAMDAGLDLLLAQLDGVEPSAAPSLDADSVGQVLSNIEQKWGQEIRTLKEELHQTILAHNHNADLIKHHKDSIDDIRNRVFRLQNGGAAKAAADIQASLARLDALPKQQQTQRKLEPLFERLTRLERQLAQAAVMRGGGGGKGSWYPGFPAMPPGVPPGMLAARGMGMSPVAMNAAAMMASMGAAGLMHGKGAGRGLGGGGRGGGAAAAAAAAHAAMQAEAYAAAVAAAVAGSGPGGEEEG
mmetsp:Transcript_71589/g.186206  ORF Transcript_71589/g.186206 Transcript_71589/m.186206 type:complete len:336 (-) Transcript_71589:93-1100(-)